MLVTERGLGVDNADLVQKLDAFRRDRSRRAEDARQMARRWADIASTDTGGQSSEAELTPGTILSLAFLIV